MSRDFTKNTANYLSFGTGAVGPLLNGASKISFCAWVNADSFDIGGTINTILHFKINGASSGVYMGVDDNGSGGDKTLRVGGRSVSTDAFQPVRGTTVIATGTNYCLGGMIDIGGDTVTLYINGAVEAGPTAVTFGNATWTYGTATAGDMVGSNTTPPSGTTNQWDGAIGEVAIWTDDIGADGFLELSLKSSPMQVRRESLVFYSKMIGNDAVERDIVGGLSGTITGTVAPLPHFPIVYPRRRVLRRLRARQVYALTADAASYTLTASAATLAAARRITGAAASYTLTVADATLTYDANNAYTLAADAASYAVTGSAAVLRADRRLSSAAASFAITGESAGLTVARRLTGAAGAFTLTGDPSTLTYSGAAVTIPAGATLRLASHNRRLALPAQSRTLRIAA